MSEFIPASAEFNDPKGRREPVANIPAPSNGLLPTKGFSTVDLAKKEFARDIALTQKHTRLNPPKKKRAQWVGTDNKDSHHDVRKFHNSIKNGLYNTGIQYNTDQKFPSLLELSCGRAGDMMKWKKHGYKNVFAIDVDPNALDEARSRVKNVDLRPVRVQFAQLNLTDGNLCNRLQEVFSRAPYTYDTVSMQFAIQYVAQDKILPEFLANVASLVKPGGTFIGTYPCGSEIKALLGSENTFDNGFLRIKELVSQGLGIEFFADFGKSQSYFEEFGTSIEYPVNFKTILRHLENYGFVLIENTDFLKSREVDGYILTSVERQFSGVFKTFVFQKRTITAYFPPQQGINWDSLKIDETGTYSITRPRDARTLHSIIKELCDKETKTVCDGTACVGGDTIHFAKQFGKVFAWEIDEERYNILNNNINVYGLTNVTTIKGSILNSSGECDLLYLDPPWGGRNYKNQSNTELFLDGKNIKTIIPELKKRFRQIAIKAPYNATPCSNCLVKKITNKINVWFVR
tara:strand:+ start:8403 stop:9953 length:1551 start_codon:yes stop_codon:yes gene_type:complete